MSDDLVKRLGIMAGVMEMGEKIAWGSDTALMREAADHIEALAALHQAAMQDALAAEAYAGELEAKLAQSVIAEYDDGSQMHLFSHAGGASVGGAWSELTIRHDLPDGTSMLRDYKASGDWYAFPAAEMEGQTDE